MKVRAQRRELFFAQLIPLVSILLGPLSTAIVVALFTPEDQGHYYLLAAFSVVVSLLQLADVESAIPQIDRRSVSTFYDALLGITFWRITIATVFLLTAGLLAYWTTILGANNAQAIVGVSYLSIVAINTIVSIPHQLSQALPVPYWRRRFIEFGVYSVVLGMALYVIREPLALLVAAASSAALNVFFSTKVMMAVHAMGQFRVANLLSRAITFWRDFIRPGQTSSGFAHIYAQSGYRLLVPASAAPLGVVYAGQLGATLAVLGLGLGLLQQGFRVQFPALTRVQGRSRRHHRLMRTLEQSGIRRIALSMFAGGIVFAIALLIIPAQFDWLANRFVSTEEILLLSAVLALTGVVGVQLLFRISKGDQSSTSIDWVVTLSVLLSIFLPARLGAELGAYGFWGGAILGPVLIFMALALTQRLRN